MNTSDLREDHVSVPAGQGDLPPGSAQPQQHPGDPRQGYASGSRPDDHTWAVFAYVGNFVVWLVAPLVIYLIKKNRSRYVRYHAAQSLNMVITYLVYLISLTILSVAVNVSGVALLLFLAIFALEITDIVYLIKAAVMANRGELYRVPRWLCFRMIR